MSYHPLKNDREIWYMDMKKTLSEFKKEIDREIGLFLDETIADYAKKDRLVADALRRVKKTVLAGGKRLRPAVMCYGYLGSGGKDRNKILKASISIELIHAFLLIHDDIMDRDNMRHGKETLHHAYKKLGSKIFLGDDSEHFGNSIAIIIGDMIAALGNQILFDSDFRPELIMKALSKLQEIISFTVVGQAKDVYMGYRKSAKESDILKMYEYKTARYTFEGPFQLGSILSGAPGSFIRKSSRFAVPLGIAFQIKDDMLGIFGDEKKIGKSVGSDIKEGKQTILLSKAMERGTKGERKILEKLIGKSEITLQDVEKFKKVIIDTGSLDYARNMIADLVAESKRLIENSEMGKEAKHFFLEVADYMEERQV